MKESDNYSSATFKVLDRREENCIFFRENKLKFSILLLLPVFDLLEVKVVSQVAKKKQFSTLSQLSQWMFYTL
mgnify:CR=1 FL=1